MHVLRIYSLLKGFHFLAITNKAAVDIHAQVFV